MLVFTAMSADELSKKIGEDYAVYDRIKYMDSGEMTKEFIHFVCYDDGRADCQVVAVLSLQHSAYTDDVVWGKHVSVDPNYQNQGIATRLVRAAVEFCELEGKRLAPSTLTDEGKAYLSHLLYKIALQHPGVLTDENKT